MKAITHCHLAFIIFSMLGVLTIFFGMLSPSYAANDDLATTISVVNGYYPQNNTMFKKLVPLTTAKRFTLLHLKLQILDELKHIAVVWQNTMITKSVGQRQN